MAPRKPEPKSALESLDEPALSVEPAAPVAMLEPLPTPLERPAPVVIGDADLQDRLEDAMLAAMDDTATGEQHALLCAHGLGSRGVVHGQRVRSEEFRLNRLRNCIARAIAPEELAAEKQWLEERRIEVSRRVDELNVELAEHMRRIRGEISELQGGLVEPAKRIEAAESALKEIRERAPDHVFAMRNQMLRNEWEPRRVRAEELRRRVEAVQRTLTEDDREYFARQGRNDEHPAAELIREMFRAGTLPPDHRGSLNASMDRQQQVLEAGLPALRARLRQELPGLQQQLAQAEAEERAAKARCDAPMEHHLRKWLSRKPPQS